MSHFLVLAFSPSSGPLFGKEFVPWDGGYPRSFPSAFQCVPRPGGGGASVALARSPELAWLVFWGPRRGGLTTPGIFC